MVSPISSPKQRPCPAVDAMISVKRCVAKRVLEIDCPLSCPFNPFNPDAPQAFDAIVGLGLAGASRWLEKMISKEEWARRFDAMDRRFGAERDLPLISYEAQWSILRAALDGTGFPELAEALEDREGSGLKNDARLVFDKLGQSEALLVQVVDPNEGHPFYTVRNVFTDESYRYVDFGDQEPLEAGALMFGRFLAHAGHLYVIPGVFVGTEEVLESILSAVQDYLGEEWEAIPAALNEALPEIWNLCAAIQDSHDELSDDELPFGDEPVSPDPCRASFNLDVDKEAAIEALERHPYFSKFEPDGIPFKPFDETIFDVYVLPVSAPPIPSLEGEEAIEEDFEEDEKPVRVGAVYIGAESMTITALNAVEMELLKGLVFQIIAFPL